MTTQPIDDTQDPAENTPAWYRQNLERMQAQLEAEKTRNRKNVFSQLGLDEGKGMGKAIATAYDGDWEADAVKAFAKAEFDWEPAEGTPTNQPPAPAPKVDPAVVHDAQARVDQVNATSLPATDGVKTDEERAWEYEKAGGRENVMAAIGFRIRKNLTP